jgi:hypothetical protein
VGAGAGAGGGGGEPVFHVELRQGVHQGRAFNLGRPELLSRFVGPWRERVAIALDGHSYAPGRAKLRVIAGRRLEPGEIGLGRGWQNAVRSGTEATEEVLRLEPALLSGAAPAAGPLTDFKLAVEGACALEARTLAEVVALAGLRHPGSRVSEQVTLAERAVWELLHEGRLAVHVAGATVPAPPERWPAILLEWRSWSSADGAPTLRAAPAAPAAGRPR